MPTVSASLRLRRKWLKAGVSEDGQWSETKVGTPQGAVASPLIANVYLHHLFDRWADVWRKKVATGDPEATDLPFEITFMLLAPRKALPPTVQLALQIPFRPSLLRQTSVREPVRLVRTPLSRCFPVHRRKQPQCPRVENTFRARSQFRRSLSKSSATTGDAGPNASIARVSLHHASIGACQHALEITSR